MNSFNFTEAREVVLMRNRTLEAVKLVFKGEYGQELGEVVLRWETMKMMCAVWLDDQEWREGLPPAKGAREG